MKPKLLNDVNSLDHLLETESLQAIIHDLAMRANSYFDIAENTWDERVPMAWQTFSKKLAALDSLARKYNLEFPKPTVWRETSTKPPLL